MNKNKIVMCVIGGIALVAVLVLGYLIFSAWQERDEMIEDLEAMKSNVQRINSAKIAPEQASVEAFETNRINLAIWRTDAIGIASQGDIALDGGKNPMAFKSELGDAAREAARLPGGVEGKIVKEGFTFGFGGLISDSLMPEPARLASLQRQWADIKFFTKTLSDSGVIELSDVVIAEKKVAAPVVESKSKKPARGKKVEEEAKPLADAQGYELKFVARPTALIKAINALSTTGERFIVIDSFVFQRETDGLASALGDKDKDGAGRAAARPRRGRRGRTGDADQPEGAEGEGSPNKKGLVVDPVSDVPFTVTLKLTTYDFGTKEPEAEEPKKEVEE